MSITSLRKPSTFVRLMPLAVAISALGCRAVSLTNDSEPTVAKRSTRIIYRSKTDRLMAATGGAAALTTNVLPPSSLATLDIQAPHPHDREGFAKATLFVTRCRPDDSPYPKNRIARSLTTAMGADVEPPHAGQKTASIDVPIEQVEGLVQMLDKANFFDKRRTILSPEVFLSAETERFAVGKRYHAVDELDALMLVTAQTGHLLGHGRDEFAGAAASSIGTANGRSSHLVRLPAVGVR